MSRHRLGEGNHVDDDRYFAEQVRGTSAGCPLEQSGRPACRRVDVHCLPDTALACGAHLCRCGRTLFLPRAGDGRHRTGSDLDGRHHLLLASGDVPS